MHFLYGLKNGAPARLVATFDSEQQLLSYVRWATLQEAPDGLKRFEQGSALVGFNDERHSQAPLTEDEPEQVPHNPSPSML